MSDCIAILPPQVADQIAAGEVIQQAGSVVKELCENSIDAGADRVDVIIKDAGRTLIQVIDNGKGMSDNDARLCFERHATSKLRTASDLMSLRTMGFRGEAMATIAAIAQVELVTRLEDNELGTKVLISGSRLESQETVAAPKGTRISVRNLFYNVPARRKFLGSNAKQYQAIRSEFVSLALAHPQVAFSLTHNGESLFQLKSGDLRQRIVALFGESLGNKLYPVDVQTEVVHIHGFAGDPSTARKRSTEQFFIVNGRCVRHPNLRRAVAEVYEPLILPGLQAVFFLCLDVHPDTIDVNVSPTKTEVKFENEAVIWSILHATIRECLGSFNAVPSIRFDEEELPSIDVYRPGSDCEPPKISFDPSYNPFQRSRESSSRMVGGWETLYSPVEGTTTPRNPLQDPIPAYESDLPVEETHDLDVLQTLFSDESLLSGNSLIQAFGRYLIFSMSENLLFIDQHRAQVRIRYDQYCRQLENRQGVSQALLFPEPFDWDPCLREELDEHADLLQYLGFQLEKDPQGYLLTGIPADLGRQDPIETLKYLLDQASEDEDGPTRELTHRLALRLARRTALPYGQLLREEEMQALCRQLFECATPYFGPDGRRIIVRLPLEEISQRF